MQWLPYYMFGKIDAGGIGFTGPKTDAGVVTGILNTVYFWLGIVAVGFIIYGGFIYMISAGDSGKVKKAKDTLLYAVIGVVVVIVAYAITNFVVSGV